MGESFGIYKLGLDEQIMPYIDMANLACGFHASDPVTMHQSIRNAKLHNVEIGAHPSYPDLVGFGRREINCSTEEIVSFIIYQCGALDALCKTYDTQISYVKPHGALYNVMMRDAEVFRAIVKAISKYNNSIKLMILSSSKNSNYANIAKKYNITLLYEVFADRAYKSDGSLVPRGEKDAVLNSIEEVKERAKNLFEHSKIQSIEGKTLTIQADSICVHGDNIEALELIKSLYELKNEY